MAPHAYGLLTFKPVSQLVIQLARQDQGLVRLIVLVLWTGWLFDVHLAPHLSFEVLQSVFEHFLLKGKDVPSTCLDAIRIEDPLE